VILFNLSGHGLMDLAGYSAFMDGQLTNHELSQADLARGLVCLEGLPKPGQPVTF
jgi:tryptophan synthase beta chain